ncbi:hypothetical protein [Spongiactinospora sp. TRM90649]|uniref:hypothetical protein n=1 Tax=Spongiactinospora sp. TRM90649 TaxID=3031114 RepID=UPI0023F82DA6|nr:hypothetical protein [Spongiactinospora sp. TRM90649]MDF5756328.1 hypothetical protein [Spongiactinospora sp. TRM90649]
MTDLHDDVFAVSPDIRYVAVATDGRVTTRSRADLADASAAESDLYEELLVNPTLITLAGRRGDIDCGGLDHLIIGYGHFHQLVIPLTDGHLSIAFELPADPAGHLPAIAALLATHGHLRRVRPSP